MCQNIMQLCNFKGNKMTEFINIDRNKDDGFTLVELAIVMIIIGLLIGGVLKGQELIANAEVTASVSQVKATESAMSTFQDAYANLPGDMTNPAARIPNCTGECARVGNANGLIEPLPGAAQTLAMEAQTFWSQLAAADILGGVIADSPAVVPTPGQTHPEFPSGGALRVGYHVGGVITGQTAAAGQSAGHYVNSTLALANIATNTQADSALSPGQASRIDSKIDDGQPNTGSVLGNGQAAAGTTSCALGTGVTDVYNTAQTSLNCNTYIRIR